MEGGGRERENNDDDDTLLHNGKDRERGRQIN